jgi:radical SAM superfamily enzyme YgiQ (UPF0313 family)
MKVLLVNTNQMKPAIAPIGLDYLADSLIAANHQTHLLDLSFSSDVPADIKDTISSFSPDVIGVTVRNTDDCYFSGGAFFLPEIKEIVCQLKEATDAPIVMGGVGFSVAPEQVLAFCGGDYGIAGEGESAFIHLLNALDTNSSLDKIPNLVWHVNGSVRRNPSVDVDLDTLPARRRMLPDNPRYYCEGGQAGFETKRGCNMACIYCADPVSKGRRVRLRSPELVVDELQALYDQGISYFHTCDCEFNIPGQHAKDVCQAIIDAGLGDKIHWYAYCSITPFDAEMASLMKHAGCAGIDFGADNGNNAILKGLGRNFTSSDLAETARLCHEYDIAFMYDLLIGGPGDTRESVRETLDLMQQIDADCVGVSMGVRIYEGTGMAEFIRSQGSMSDNPNLYGAKKDNLHFLRPVFYISPDLGDGIIGYMHSLVGEDTRFFLPSNEEVDNNYNYNANTVLVNAIANGERGAYWDMLRKKVRSK